MTTVGAWLAAQAELERRDGEVLLSRAAGLTRAQIMARPERPLPEAVLARLEDWARRRRAGEPVAYILGEREFWGLTLEVTPDVLVPRPDTELLVETALEALVHMAGDLPGRAIRMLDLGTGSGAVAIAIAVETSARGCAVEVTGTDVSAAALAVAARNAQRHGAAVRWVHGDWFDAVNGRYDVIVSNPPYVKTGDPHLPALVHEPGGALVAGTDGLDAIRVIAAGAHRHLNAAGMLALEHGFDQGFAVRQLLGAAGFCDVSTRRDLAGLDRVTSGRRRPCHEARAL